MNEPHITKTPERICDRCGIKLSIRYFKRACGCVCFHHTFKYCSPHLKEQVKLIRKAFETGAVEAQTCLEDYSAARKKTCATHGANWQKDCWLCTIMKNWDKTIYSSVYNKKKS